MEEDFPVIQNQGWTGEIGKSYQRLPDRAKEVVRKNVWNLSGNSAGLAIHFYTNAERIEVRYGVNGTLAMNHMPATGKSGVDLYAIDPDGRWRILTDKFAFGDTITYTISYSNVGTQAATLVTVTDAQPLNTTYIVNSSKVNNVSKTDAADADEVTLSGGTMLQLNIGQVLPGVSGTITLKVKVN